MLREQKHYKLEQHLLSVCKELLSVFALVGFGEEIHPVPPYSPAMSTDKFFFIGDSDSSSNLA